MSTIEESVDVEVPVSTAYSQWTQFESFPRFMDGVERVEQRDDTLLHWVAEIGGVRHEWDARITEQQLDRRSAWEALDDVRPDGVVTLRELDENRTRVRVQMDYAPRGVVELVGSMVGIDGRRVKGDLKSFKELVEESSKLMCSNRPAPRPMSGRGHPIQWIERRGAAVNRAFGA